MKSEIMPYARDTSRLRVEPALFVFPGDEVVGAAAYTAAMMNTYLRKVPLAGALMEQYGVPFSAEDKERVKRLMVSMGWLDHLLDEAPDRDAAIIVYQDLIQSLHGKSQPPALPGWARPELGDITTLLRNATSVLPADYIESVVAKALRIGDISLEKSASARVRDYAALLSEEGSLSSDVVVECVSTIAHQSDGYIRLHRWNRKAMTAATLLDAAIDLKQDYADSLTSVPPTTINRMYIFWRACTYIPIVLWGLGLRGIKTVVRIGAN